MALDSKLVTRNSSWRADKAIEEGQLAASCKNIVFCPPVWGDTEQQYERGQADKYRDDKAEEGLVNRDEQNPADQ